MRFELVNTKKKLDAWCARLDRVKRFAIDTETTGTNSMTCDLVGISMTVCQGDVFRSVYIPVGHSARGLKGRNQLDLDLVLDRLAPYTEDAKWTKILQNAVYDLVVLKRYGVHFANVDDTLLMSFLLEPKVGIHGMDAMASRFLKVDTARFEDVVLTDPLVGMKNFADVRLEDALFYAAEDTEITYRLWRGLRLALKDHDGLWQVWRGIDRNLVHVLADMKFNGIAVDLDRCAMLEAKWQKEMDEALEIIHEHRPGLNPNSPPQIQEWLYDEMKLPIIEKTATGAGATDAKTLKLYEFEHPAIPALLTYKTYDKLVNTYLTATPKRKDAAPMPVVFNTDTGRVHPGLNLTSTATARLSSSGPNLQNIPGASSRERGVEIRRAFIAPAGRKLIVSDYGNIELKILAEFTKEPVLVEAFRAYRDVHSEVATKVFGVTAEEAGEIKWDELRTAAKRVSFGLIYGISSIGLSKQLNVHPEVAQEFIVRYFDGMPVVDEWIRAQKTEGIKSRRVRTMFGRPLQLEKRRDRMGTGMAERQAVNYQVQGTAADLMRLAMCNVARKYEEADIDASLLLTVHDELIAEASKRDADQAAELMREGMITAADHLVEWIVPITADPAIGNNWHDAKTKKEKKK